MEGSKPYFFFLQKMDLKKIEKKMDIIHSTLAGDYP
jgi:hypothetical protein